MGLGIRYEQVGQLVDYFKGTVRAGYDISRVRHDYFPSVDKIPTALTTTRRELSYTVRLGKTGGYDEEGNPLYNYVTVTSDVNMTVGDILSEAESYYDENESNYPVEAVEPVVVQARKRG